MNDREQDRRKTPKSVADLRQRAEAQAGAAEPVSLAAQTPEAIEQLIHELRVHQFELEMQNEELRKAQAEIEAGRARYLDLYDLAPVGYVTVSEEGLILEANLTATTLLGVKRGALINQSLARFILEEDLNIYYLNRKKLLKTGEPQGQELRLVKSDGSAFWAWLDGAIAEGSGGKPVCHVVLSDISERKQAEAALKESEERFSLAMDASKDGIWDWDLTTGAIYCSPALTAMLGYDSNKVIENVNQWQELIHPEDRQKAYQTNMDCVNGHTESFEVEYRMQTRDGVWKWIVGRGRTVYRASSGRAMRVTGTHQDITERKQAEEALLQEKLEKELIINNLSEQVAFLDLEMNIVWANSEVIKRHNLSSKDYLGEKCYKAYHQLAEPCPDCQIIDVFKTGVPSGGIHRSPDGCYWQMAGKPVLDKDGVMIGVLDTALEISDLKLAEEEIRTLNKELEQRVAERTVQLEALNKELQSFAYSISHDFRAPLRALDGFSASLQTKYDEHLDDEGRHYLDRIRNAAIYMSNLVDDLLNLSRITRQEFKQQQVDLSKLVAEIFAALQEAEPQRQTTIKIAPDLQVRGDAALLQSALQNLLENAWKFSSKEAQAEIEVGRTTVDGEEVFFVRDNGVGFNMAYAKNLFGAFQRLHGVNEFPGTGIGLATVQRIINRHGGRIWTEAEVGKGATFYFTLK
jgi:PAS domain S-box-containing protein